MFSKYEGTTNRTVVLISTYICGTEAIWGTYTMYKNAQTNKPYTPWCVRNCKIYVKPVPTSPNGVIGENIYEKNVST